MQGITLLSLDFGAFQNMQWHRKKSFQIRNFNTACYKATKRCQQSFVAETFITESDFHVSSRESASLLSQCKHARNENRTTVRF